MLMLTDQVVATKTTTCNLLWLTPSLDNKQQQSEYKHSLTFRVWRYMHFQCIRTLHNMFVVIGTKPVNRLQIRPSPILHNYRAPPNIRPSYSRVCAVVWECSERHTDTQTAVVNTHFASATPHAKCNNMLMLGCCYDSLFLDCQLVPFESCKTPISLTTAIFPSWINADFLIKC